MARVLRSWYLWPAHLISGYKSSLLMLLVYVSCVVTEERGTPKIGVTIAYVALALFAYQFAAFFFARRHLERRVQRARGGS